MYMNKSDKKKTLTWNGGSSNIAANSLPYWFLVQSQLPHSRPPPPPTAPSSISLLPTNTVLLCPTDDINKPKSSSVGHNSLQLPTICVLVTENQHSGPAAQSKKTAVAEKIGLECGLANGERAQVIGPTMFVGGSSNSSPGLRWAIICENPEF
jgi:hypothetical protein